MLKLSLAVRKNDFKNIWYVKLYIWGAEIDDVKIPPIWSLGIYEKDTCIKKRV